MELKYTDDTVYPEPKGDSVNEVDSVGPLAQRAGVYAPHIAPKSQKELLLQIARILCKSKLIAQARRGDVWGNEGVLLVAYKGLLATKTGQQERRGRVFETRIESPDHCYRMSRRDRNNLRHQRLQGSGSKLGAKPGVVD